MNKDTKQLAENYLAMPGGLWNPFNDEMHPDVVEEQPAQPAPTATDRISRDYENNDPYDYEASGYDIYGKPIQQGPTPLPPGVVEVPPAQPTPLPPGVVEVPPAQPAPAPAVAPAPAPAPAAAQPVAPVDIGDINKPAGAPNPAVPWRGDKGQVLPGHFLAEIQPQFVEDNILDAAMAKYIVDGRKGAPKEVGRIYNMGPMGQVEWDGEKWVQLPAYKYDAKRDSNPPLGTKLADGTVKDRINTAPIKTYPTPDGPSFWPYELIKPEIQHQPMAGPIQHREPMIAGEFAFNASRLLNFLTNASPEEREKVEGKLSDEQKEEIDALRALLVRILASIEQASQKSTPPAA